MRANALRYSYLRGLVSPGKELKSGHLYMGRPTKEVRPLTPEEIANFTYSAQHCCRLKANYLAEE